MLRSERSERLEASQVGCSRLGHLMLPISGKPEIGWPLSVFETGALKECVLDMHPRMRPLTH
jgi:hypothetical protein